MKNFNLVRYILSVISPIVVLLAFGWIWCIVALFTILYLNNVTDDIMFYYGSCITKKSRRREKICSPAEGIVTKIERNVPLYSHLYKEDVLTKEELVDSSIKSRGVNYCHIAIFLNKFNKHAVANMFDEISTITQYDKDGEMVAMVNNNELIADNEGEYLENTFVDIEYTNGTHVVLTMDKYVSKAVLSKSRQDVELLICKGSQCDLYIPEDFIEGQVAVRLNAPIGLLEQIAVCNNKRATTVFPEFFRRDVMDCIKDSGFSVGYAFRDNIVKTLHTIKYNKTYLVIAIAVSVLFPEMFPILFSVYIYAFCVVRYYKNFLYNLMNIIGYKEWMTKTYTKLNRFITYGKK